MFLYIILYTCRPTCIIFYDNFIIKIRLFFHSLFMYLNCTDNKDHDWRLWWITWWPLHDACYFFRKTENSPTPSNQPPKHQSPTSKTPNRKTPNRKISKQKNLQTEKSSNRKTPEVSFSSWVASDQFTAGSCHRLNTFS